MIFYMSRIQTQKFMRNVLGFLFPYAHDTILTKPFVAGSLLFLCKICFYTAILPLLPQNRPILKFCIGIRKKRRLFCKKKRYY